MKSPKQLLSEWLDRPQVTNRQALVIGVIGSVLASALLYGGGELLQALNLIDFNSTVPVWLAAIAAGATLALGLMVGGGKRRKAQALRDQISDLEHRTEELSAYDAYAEHLRDALADLRRAIAQELPAFSLRDFIVGGLFEPAQRFLAASGVRGDIRFSVLHRQGDDFVMADESGPYPALGHTLEGRQAFRMPMSESFSMYAFQRGKVFASGKVSEDDRFTPNPKARRPYESIVSVPLWKAGQPEGVLNVIATEPYAFSAVDRSYLTLLGAVIDVARAPQAAMELQESDPPALPPGSASD